MNLERIDSTMDQLIGRGRYVAAAGIAVATVIGVVVLTLTGYGPTAGSLMIEGFAIAAGVAGIASIHSNVKQVNAKADHLLNGGTARQVRAEVGTLLADFATANNLATPPSVVAAAAETSSSTDPQPPTSPPERSNLP